ncbi:MAG: enoyl-CoA hydratase/isomerase family protein [Alphaproteobacteria bacterium]|nr:enoyl-CoA hydratase/isomerase family protein [Alphaproteobacteria bacterium]
MSDTDVVLVERDGDIATVVLNRPEKLNALNKPMWRRLGEVMREIGEDASIRCVVLRGAGDRAMGPGADISEFETERANTAQATEYGGLMHSTMHAVRDCPHPVIALIKGLCVGGALEIALMCDMRICGEGSRFGVPINRLGLVMAYPEVEALVGLVGRSVALEILYEARVFDAAEAKDKGLVNRVVADDAVEDEVYTAARRIADGAPLVNRWHKKFVDRVLAGGPPLTEAEKAEGFACFDTEDFNTGYRAFLAKEKPEFKGR